SFGSMETPPMEPTEWASWMSRIGGTIDSHTVAVARIRPELSIIPDEQQAQQAQQPELLMLITDTVMPGKSFEYEAFIRDEILPALRQTDIPAAIANEVIFGTEGRTWVFAVPMQGWEELDRPSPLIEAIGPEAAQQLMQRGEALVDSRMTEVMRYRADLSSQSPLWGAERAWSPGRAVRGRSGIGREPPERGEREAKQREDVQPGRSPAAASD